MIATLSNSEAKFWTILSEVDENLSCGSESPSHPSSLPLLLCSSPSVRPPVQPPSSSHPLPMKLAVVSARIGLSNEVWCVWWRECAFLCHVCTVRACSLSTSSLYLWLHQVNEEGPVDCIIWKKSSTAYKKQASELDGTSVLMFMYTEKQKNE